MRLFKINFTSWGDTAALYEKLESAVVPIFYNDRNRFADMMRHCIALNGSFFNTQRMLRAIYPEGLLRMRGQCTETLAHTNFPFPARTRPSPTAPAQRRSARCDRLIGGILSSTLFTLFDRSISPHPHHRMIFRYPRSFNLESGLPQRFPLASPFGTVDKSFAKVLTKKLAARLRSRGPHGGCLSATRAVLVAN